MGNQHSKSQRRLKVQPDKMASTSGSTMSIPKPRRQLPKIKFRVLVIGRANAGKTSILQRVCDTTDSPVIFRKTRNGREQVQLDPSMDRGEHSIEDEIVFSNHDGYVFHDSCGFEAGSNEELGTVQRFIREISKERRLPDRLHAIWYCVPMDNQRPELDLRFFDDICPDRNVPVIAVFTKYDQFLRNAQMYLEDYGNPDDSLSDVAERQFKEHYLRHLQVGDGARFVRLEKMHKPEARCHTLLTETVEALSGDVVTLMFLTVQKMDLELSINFAVERARRIGLDEQARDVIEDCLFKFSFPQIWVTGYWGLKFLYREGGYYANELTDADGWWVAGSVDEREAKQIISHIMSLPIITQHTPASNSIYHLRLAIILIFKHAANLCLSGTSAKLALTQVESDYQEANIASKIEEHFMASFQEYSNEQFIKFLMNTSIEASK